MDVDDDGRVKYSEPYDCNAAEPRPDSVVYTEIFKDPKRSTSNAVALPREPLEKSSFKNAITEGLLKEIGKRTEEEFPDQIVIGFAGNMSAGMVKSAHRIGNMLMWCRQEFCHQFDFELWHCCSQGKPKTLYLLESANMNQGDSGDSCT
jgi:hypothetical protein